LWIGRIPAAVPVGAYLVGTTATATGIARLNARSADRVQFSGAGATLNTPAGVPAANHVAICGTYDGTTARLYADAALVDSAAAAGAGAIDTARIGTRLDTGANAAAAEYRVCGVWNRALSADEIATIQAIAVARGWV